MKYADKLKDPRWQKKRLEIFNRDNWQCCVCKAADRTLVVHHKQYSGDPWEASDDQLRTLCTDCHYDEHNPEYNWERIQLISKESNTLVSGLIETLYYLHKEGAIDNFKKNNLPLGFIPYVLGKQEAIDMLKDKYLEEFTEMLNRKKT